MGPYKRLREKKYDGPVWVPIENLRNWFIYVAAYLVRPIMKLVFRYKTIGRETIPRAGEFGEQPGVFACTHVSFADPVILWSVLFAYGNGCRFLARSSLFRPVIGGLIARAGAIPIDPDTADRKALKRAASALKRGENLLIFPEGTRMNRPDKVYHPHAGVVLIANMGKAKIVPVGISGTERIMPYGKPKFLRFPRIYCNFGEPIDPKDPAFAELPKKERSMAVANAVMDRCFELRDEARDKARS